MENKQRLNLVRGEITVQMLAFSEFNWDSYKIY